MSTALIERHGGDVEEQDLAFLRLKGLGGAAKVLNGVRSRAPRR
jgi:hypothetical protein